MGEHAETFFAYGPPDGAQLPFGQKPLLPPMRPCVDVCAKTGGVAKVSMIATESPIATYLIGLPPIVVATCELSALARSGARTRIQTERLRSVRSKPADGIRAATFTLTGTSALP